MANLFYKCDGCGLEVCLDCGDDIRTSLGTMEAGWNLNLVTEDAAVGVHDTDVDMDGYTLGVGSAKSM